MRIFARNASNRKAVAAIRCDVYFGSHFIKVQQLERVGAHLRVKTQKRQTDYSIVVVTQAQLTTRSQHAIADVTIGAASSNLEVARQLSARQANNDLVANHKVARATNDAAHVVAAIRGFLTLTCNANLTPTNGLAIRLGLFDKLKNLANNERASHAKAV